MASPTLRTPLARAKGLGSARRGADAWLAERVSAVALVPLTLWLITSFVMLHGASYPDFIAWIRKPVSSVLMVFSLIALFHHTALGLEVVIEDYVHSAAKLPALVACRLLCSALCMTGILAILRIDVAPLTPATGVPSARAPDYAGDGRVADVHLTGSYALTNFV